MQLWSKLREQKGMWVSRDHPKVVEGAKIIGLLGEDFDKLWKLSMLA